MKLDRILEGLNILEIQGNKDLEIKGLTSDSRAVKKGYLFVAVKGDSQDGHRYCQSVLARKCLLELDNQEHQQKLLSCHRRVQ